MLTSFFLLYLIRQAGCRTLINMVLLRVASVMSFADTSVNIIPEFPIPRTTFTTQDSGNLSFSGIVDFLVTRLPSRYSMYLLRDPTTALANPQSIKGPLTSIIFEAKRENVRAALPRAVTAAAAYCRHRSIPVVRGCVTGGEEWIFFLYETTGDGRGAVRSSPEFNLRPQLEGLALVVGILEDWINNATQSTLQFFSLE
ncbi:hypothetical protein M378DRAFT_637639 [Amanita muscaria Koide BX008]|uniref:Uncharacterized protein n=1 Tax=Amanita muscaria (strain Koide BX008) TaxID=946122 RepID=A0A0C2X4E3_AMAMK|nr:hypothetical protein M378DRAFT_637639 [Amanita muscaria Koide BX008]